jgi:hypothetical protein
VDRGGGGTDRGGMGNFDYLHRGGMDNLSLFHRGGMGNLVQLLLISPKIYLLLISYYKCTNCTLPGVHIRIFRLASLAIQTRFFLSFIVSHKSYNHIRFLKILHKLDCCEHKLWMPVCNKYHLVQSSFSKLSGGILPFETLDVHN